MRIILCFLVCALLFSCKKDYNKAQRKPLDYSITGLPDTASMMQTDTLRLPFTVQYVGGDKELVSLMVSGLPSSMTAGFSSSTDTPSYNSTIRIISTHANTGYYQIGLTASDSRDFKSYGFVVRVIPDTVSLAQSIAGSYRESGPCTVSGSLNDTVQVTVISFNKVKLTGLWNGNQSTQLIADLDAASQTITIQPQTINNAVFSGSGSFTGTQITISYTVAVATATDACTTVLNRL